MRVCCEIFWYVVFYFIRNSYNLLGIGVGNDEFWVVFWGDNVRYWDMYLLECNLCGFCEGWWYLEIGKG